MVSRGRRSMVDGLVVLLAAAPSASCRSDPAPSEPPPTVQPLSMPEQEEDSREARPEETTEPEPTMSESHTESPPARGPTLSAEAVIPAFRRWWAAFSGDQLTHHRHRPRLDERVAAVGSVRVQACAALAQHIRERAPTGSPELLHGNPATLEGMTEDCWWVHHDGMLGPGLGAALSKDGHVLVVWIVPEG